MIKTEKYIEALKDISYYDWIRLREGIDREFNRKIDESKKSFKLTDSENVKKIIRSQFGDRKAEESIMPGYNFNHFTGKTRSSDPRKNRKKKIRIKRVHRNKYEKLASIQKKR